MHLYLLAELTEDNLLLSLALAAMQGYQRLSPSIFSQVDFNVAQLLFPPPSGSHDDQGSHDPQVMLPTLQLLLDVPAESLKWQQKVGGCLERWQTSRLTEA